jgi:general secretion pathway protein G
MNQKSKKHSKKSGFTMIELLVVIVILGILSVIGLGSFSASQQKARDSRRKTDLRTIGDALEVYYNDKGGYPSSASGLILGCGAAAQETCTPGGIWENSDNSTTYMVQIPTDPSGGMYYYISDGTYYQIYARLENDRDRDVPTDVNGDPTYYTSPANEGGDCVTGACNYGRSSTNSNLGGIN